MELEQLLGLLGVSNFAEAVAAVTRMNAFLTDARAQTGRSNTAEILDGVRAQSTFARSVEQAVGAQGGDAIARIAALQASAERLTQVEAQMQAQARAQGDIEAGGLMDEAIRAGRLEPAKRDKAQAIYGEYGIKALRTFIEMLPAAQVSPTNSAGGNRGPTQPHGGNTQNQQTEEGLTVESLTADERAVAKAMGKTPEAFVESKKFWAKTSGRLEDADLIQMNAAQLQARTTQTLGAR